MDYSSAGYMGGGVALPAPFNNVITLMPSGGDDTCAIQNAISNISTYQPDVNTGFRGVVFFGSGNFTISSQLSVAFSGIVFRGNGTGQTTLWLAAASPFTLFNVSPSSPAYVQGTPNVITDYYVPSGSDTLNVSTPNNISVGQSVCIIQNYTSAWCNSINAFNWSPFTVTQQRVVTAITGNTLAFDVPLPDSINASLNPGNVSLCHIPNLVTQIGFEHFTAGAAFLATDMTSPQSGLITINGTSNAYLNNIRSINLSQGIVVGTLVRFITIQNIDIVHTSSCDDPIDIDVSGSSVLVQQVSGSANNYHLLSSGVSAMGPIVYLNNQVSGRNSAVGPLQHWGQDCSTIN